MKKNILIAVMFTAICILGFRAYREYVDMNKAYSDLGKLIQISDMTTNELNGPTGFGSFISSEFPAQKEDFINKVNAYYKSQTEKK
jgi:hypothetical protein